MSRSALLLVLAGVIALPAQQPPSAASPQQPVFRGTAMLVYVDAYPTKDGHVVEGLTPPDFEVREDGKVQQVEFFEFLHFDVNAADADRRDPSTQEDGNRLAGDPHHRAFVAYFDPYHLTADAARNMRLPVVEFLERVIGPSDYFAALNPDVSVKNLVFGQRTETLRHEVDAYWPRAFEASLVDGSGVPLSPHEAWLKDCYLQRTNNLATNEGIIRNLFARWRTDLLMTGLRDLTAHLAEIRNGRTNVLLFASPWPLPSVDDRLMQFGWGRTSGPGIIGGQLQARAHPPGTPDTTACDAELMRLATLDVPQQYHDLIDQARRADVAFSTIDPGGLAAFDTDVSNPARRSPTVSVVESGLDVLRVLALNTHGTAIVATNDIRSPLRRLADDVSSYYLLGYYTTNTKLDGKYHKIDVKVRTPDVAVDARKGYVAFTEQSLHSRDLAATPAAGPAEPSPIDEALSALARLHAPEGLFTDGAASSGEVAIVAEIASGQAAQWSQGADVKVGLIGPDGASVGTADGRIEPGARSTVMRIPVGASAGPWRAKVNVRNTTDSLTNTVDIRPAGNGLLGDPLVFRATPAARSPLRPVADHQFRRTERVHIEWPVLQPLERRVARVLDRKGLPLPLEVALTERNAAGHLVLAADLNLAPLASGDYLVELVAGRGPVVGGQGADTERRLLAIHVEQ